MNFSTAWLNFFNNIYDGTFIITLLMLSLGLAFLEFKLHRDYKFYIKIFGKFAILFVSFTLLLALTFSSFTALKVMYPALMNVAYSVIIAVYFFIMYKDKNYINRSIKYIVFIAVAIVDMEVSKDLGHVAGTLSNDNVVLVTFARSAPLLLIFSLTFVMNKFNISEYDKIPHSILTIVILTSVLLLVSTALQNYFIENQFDITIYVLFIIMYVSLIIILDLCYFSLYYVTYSANKNLELEVNATLTNAEKEAFKVSKENYEEISKLRHDIKNHFSYIHLLLEDNKVEEAKKYIESYSDTNLKVLNPFKCSNDTIRVILELELTKAKIANTSLDLDIIVPKTLPIRKTHLVSLLTNIIDNAIENNFNKEVPIKVSIKIHNDYFRITVTNSIDSSKKDFIKELRTRKCRGHGYGTKIISSIAKEYNGYADFLTENDKFICDVILSIKGENDA